MHEVTPLSESAVNILNAEDTAEDFNLYELEPTMTHEFYMEHKETVERIARQQHKRSKIFSVDDVEQAIWLAFAQRWLAIRSYPAKSVVQLARMAAAEWCKKERLDYSYFLGKVIYTTEEVKRILRESTWEDLGPGIDVEGRVDVRAAFKSITPAMQRNVFRIYGLKDREASSAVQVSASRGVRAITDHLNAHLVSDQKEIESL